MTQIISTFSRPDPFSPIEEQVTSLLLAGQIELAKKHLDKGLEYFQEASILKPEDEKLYFEQASSLLDFGTEERDEKALLAANKKFKLVTFLNRSHFQAWYFWGLSLSNLGEMHQKYHYFPEAEEKLSKALEISRDIDKETLSDLYAEYAKVKANIAKHSKEAYDWRLCIDAYEKAVKAFPVGRSDFWNGFGNACLELSNFFADLKLCLQAIDCYKCALSHNPNDLTGWKNLSIAMESLYKQTHDEEHFSQTCQCFDASLRLAPEDFDTHSRMALFLVRAAGLSLELKKLLLAVEKCQEVTTLETKLNLPPSPLLLSAFGLALSLKGELTESIELIHEGQNKIAAALEIDGNIPFAWKCFGESCIVSGKYFDEQDYYYQAIEKFQTGLSIDRTGDELWMGIGTCYTLIGTLTEDVETLKKSLYFYEKALDLNPYASHYYFAKAHCLSKIGEFLQEEGWIESSIQCFEKALQLQKNAIYAHPGWLFEYAKTLDLYADFFEEESHYHKAIEIFLHVLVINPDFPQIHYRLALVYSHLAELLQESQNFYRAVHFFKLALKRDENNDQILVDLAVTLMNIAQHTGDSGEIESCYLEAEKKLTFAAQEGNLQSYYQLACLFSLKNETEKSLSFLKRADSFNALPSIEDLLEDEWLDHVRCLSAFKEFLLYLETKASLQEGL